MRVAAGFGDSEKVKVLLKDHRSLIFNKNDAGETLLHMAKTKDVAELLLVNGAKVNAKSKDGKTPLHLLRNTAKRAW